MKNFVCVHGHFYQPPRENPWLNEVEMQESAYPFHDWNARINAECYCRNTASRILNKDGKISDIINNYSRISFNFGPTLLQWMRHHAKNVYASILEADDRSKLHFSGHGSALAQAYNHMIMPLSNGRDKETQVIWGIRDFEYRFKRKPEGMWLPETACDTPTLEMLAKYGIKFTILSPYQADKVRKIGTKEWTDVKGGKVDPKRPYLCNLPSGKNIVLFFYDGPISQSVAFENLLDNGEKFASRLTTGFDEEIEGPQLVHIATDGETYGHHHRFGEMALSFALYDITKNKNIAVTNYAEYLEKFPPTHEAQIIEASSWSCVHGVERWNSDCGCNTGGHPDWNQKWRKPLREAFDWLRDALIPVYENEMKKYVEDPWQIRNEYIEVILDRDESNVLDFINRRTYGNLDNSQKSHFLKLLEMQHHAMLMYTSCGWFFDEVTGIETTQDIAYAARALQLAEDSSNVKLEDDFKAKLALAKSNIPENRDAAFWYEKSVRPTMLDLIRVGAHHAISSLFDGKDSPQKIYSFYAFNNENDYDEAGKYRLVIGRTDLKSEMTLEEMSVTYAVLYLGEHHLFGGIMKSFENEKFEEIKRQMKTSFDMANVHEVILQMDEHFGSHSYSFWHLFRDEQHRIMEEILAEPRRELNEIFTNIFEDHYPLMQAMSALNLPIPDSFKMSIQHVIKTKINEILDEETIDYVRLELVKNESERLKIKIDDVTINLKFERRLNHIMRELSKEPENMEIVKGIIKLLDATLDLNFNLEKWEAQNIAFKIKKEYYDTKPEIQANQELWSLIMDMFSKLNLGI